MRFFVAWTLFALPVAAAQDDARTFLAKARDAVRQNRDRERYWNWTTTTTRSVTRFGQALESLPSVTVESPIRSDGKRCNAVLAWGDGREPYLANASADARCTVESEVRDLLNEDSLLRARRVRLRSRSKDAIVLAVSRDKELLASQDPYDRCTGSVRGTVELDPATFFPKNLDLEIVDHGCEQQVPVVNHYDEQPVRSAMSTFRKGATAQWEFSRQRDKSGAADRDYWLAVRRHSVRPLWENARVLIVWGRRFELDSFGRDRTIVIDASTTASELSTDAILKFAPQL